MESAAGLSGLTGHDWSAVTGGVSTAVVTMVVLGREWRNPREREREKRTQRLNPSGLKLRLWAASVVRRKTCVFFGGGGQKKKSRVLG